MAFGLDQIKGTIALAAALISALTGGLTLSGKLGWNLFSRDILEWSPEDFSISNGTIEDGFKVIVAREKFRDDCDVADFSIEIKDSDYIVHPAIPSVAKFSGPASDEVELFGYRMYIDGDKKWEVAPGRATLLGQITYDCPEGEKIVTYPSHSNLTFTIEDIK